MANGISELSHPLARASSSDDGSTAENSSSPISPQIVAKLALKLVDEHIVYQADTYSSFIAVRAQ
jgi:hypothetical protein